MSGANSIFDNDEDDFVKERCNDVYHNELLSGTDKFVTIPAKRECGMCGRKLCMNCTRQGFECTTCEHYGCRLCESKTKALQCENCTRKLNFF